MKGAALNYAKEARRYFKESDGITDKAIRAFRAAHPNTRKYTEELGVRWTVESVEALVKGSPGKWLIAQVAAYRGESVSTVSDWVHRKERFHDFIV
jgi:hypothetical protein